MKTAAAFAVQSEPWARTTRRYSLQCKIRVLRTFILKTLSPNRASFCVLFILTCMSILTITGGAKVWLAFTPVKMVKVPDPITGISFGNLMLAVGVLELVIASICLFAKSQPLRLGLIAWLATNFVAYRLGLWWIGWHKPCSCLGNLTDALHLKPEVADNIIKVILAYLLLGSYAGLFWLWRQGRNAPKRVVAE